MLRLAARLLVWWFLLAVLLAGGPVGLLYVCGPYWFVRYALVRP